MIVSWGWDAVDVQCVPEGHSHWWIVHGSSRYDERTLSNDQEAPEPWTAASLGVYALRPQGMANWRQSETHFRGIVSAPKPRASTCRLSQVDRASSVHVVHRGPSKTGVNDMCWIIQQKRKGRIKLAIQSSKQLLLH
jgi:hypothetical protein